MSRIIRIALLSLLALAAIVALSIWGVYLATQRVRPFYQQALVVEPAQLELAGLEMESRATVLYSEAQQVGRWNAVFTDEQINGWLATQFVENYGDQLPSSFTEPRVAITPESLTLAFRTSQRGIETVVSIDANVFLTEEGAIAVELLSVRAGAFPLPALQIADQVAEACQSIDLPVRWTHRDGRAVALVEVTDYDSAESQRVHVDTLELHNGELYVAGYTEEVITTAP